MGTAKQLAAEVERGLRGTHPQLSKSVMSNTKSRKSQCISWVS